MLLYYKEETEGKANLCDTAGKGATWRLL